MMEKMLNVLRGVDRFVLTLLKAFTILCFSLLTVLISANVFVRFFPMVSLHWFDEIIELLYAYLVFYGAAALWITREHFSVGDWISGRLIRHPKAIRVYRLVLECRPGVRADFLLLFPASDEPGHGCDERLRHTEKNTLLLHAHIRPGHGGVFPAQHRPGNRRLGRHQDRCSGTSVKSFRMPTVFLSG
jgi:hypothetical protein